MKKTPLLFLSSRGLEGDVPSFWAQPSNGNDPLPHASNILASLPPELFDQPRLSIVLDERALNPIRISVEKKLAKRDTESYVRWKLKKSLPFPVDHVVLRYRPLAGTPSVLALTLPEEWVRSVFRAFQERGVKCGFIGGLFHLMTTHHQFRGQALLVLFPDSYVYCVVDKKGALVDYRHRRLPLDANGYLDVAAISTSDLTRQFQDLNQHQTLVLVNLAQGLDASIPALQAHLTEQHSDIHPLALSGSVLQRVHTIMDA